MDDGVLVFHIPDIKGDKAESKLGAEFVRKVLIGWEVSYKGGTYSTGVKHLPGMKRDIVLWYVFLDQINGKSLDIEGITANNRVIFTLSESI
ncbi:MAG: hypothetical protein ACYC4E_02715 [Carboxydocellales bacterium]